MLGGRWADRSPYPITLYRIIAWGAFLIGLIPFLALPLLRLARDSLQNLGNLNVALVVLAFGVTLILFAVPVTLDGLCLALCRAPRHARRQRNPVEPSAACMPSQRSAVSSDRSCRNCSCSIGFGTRGTFVFLALLLLALALFYLKRAALKLIWMPIVLILLALLVPRLVQPVSAARSIRANPAITTFKSSSATARAICCSTKGKASTRSTIPNR